MRQETVVVIVFVGLIGVILLWGLVALAWQ